MPTQLLIFLVTAIGVIGYTIYTFLDRRHKERMAIIEKGSEVNFYATSSRSYKSSLKWGIIFLSLGVGLSIGIFMDIVRHHDGPFFTFPLIILFIGLGQILYYRIRKNEEDA